MNPIFISHTGRGLSRALVEAIAYDLRLAGIDVRDDHISNWDNINDTASLLMQATTVIAIFEEQNDNVLFQIGFALGAGKSVLIICSPDIKLPIGLNNIDCIRRDLKDPNLFFEVIRRIELLNARNLNLRPPRTDLDTLLREYKSDRSLLGHISPMEFETLITQWFQRRGLITERHGSAGQLDFGVDFIIRDFEKRDCTGVQVKMLSPSSKVGIGDIQRFESGCQLLQVDAGLYITTSGYSASARDYAVTSKVPIILWTTDNLLE